MSSFEILPPDVCLWVIEFWSLNNEKLKSVWEQEHQFSYNWSKGNNNSICRESARLGLGYFVINVARRYVEFNTRKAICQCCWCWCWLEGKVAPVQSTFCEYCYFGQIHREGNPEDKLGVGQRRVGGSGRVVYVYNIYIILGFHCTSYWSKDKRISFFVIGTENKTWRTNLAMGGGLVVVAVCGVEFCQLAI